MAADSVAFHDIQNYVPGKRIEVTYSLRDGFIPDSRDWVGLFQEGWTSSKDYSTYVWAPPPNDNKGSVTFAGWYLPQNDYFSYQFCYISSDGRVMGTSSPFRFSVGVSFNSVLKNYPPEKPIEVTYTLKDGFKATLEDWVGLFRVGWSSSENYYANHRVSPHNDNKGSVVFAGQYLPPQDEHFYQFCYISSEGRFEGTSSRFQFSAGVSFNGVLKNYPPGKNIEVEYSLGDGFNPDSRDWVGLFRFGWSSSKDYCTYVWAPTPHDKESSVVFTGQYLSSPDGHLYQFCYVNKDGTVNGASLPFQFSHEYK